MSNPCYGCVKPERYPGCHDHCKKLKTYYESDEYKKLCNYKDTYFKTTSVSSVEINRRMRYLAKKGRSLHQFKYATK